MLLYLLGPYYFHAMNGMPGLPQTQIGAETRVGTNGTSLYDLGTWAHEPWHLETVLGTQNYADALAHWQLYHRLAATGPVSLTIGGQRIVGGKFQILNIQPLEIKPVLAFKAAGDNTIYRGILRVRWTLLPITDEDNL